MDNYQYNLTKIIEQAYISDNVALKDMLKTVNFAEVSKISVKYKLSTVNNLTEKEEFYGFQNSNIEQSLALNCITTLPLEAYQDYITPEWMFFENKEAYSIFHAALNSKQYPFLNKLFDIATEKYNNFDVKDSEYHNYATQYSNSALHALLNIGKVIEDLDYSGNNTIEGYDSYYQLFKKAVTQYPVYRVKHINSQTTSPIYKEKQEQINENNWFLSFDKVTSLFYKFAKKEDILKTIVQYTNAFHIYMDIYNQLETTPNNPLKNMQVLEKAINSGNHLVVNHLSSQLNVSANQINRLINKAFTTEYENYSEAYNDKEGNMLSDSAYTEHLKKLKKLYQLAENIPQYDYKKNKHLINIVLLDKEFVSSLFDKKPEIKKDMLIQNCTIHEWMKAEKIFTEFLDKHGLQLTDHKGKKTDSELKISTYDLLLVSKFKKHVKYKEPSIDRKFAIQDLVANNYLPLISGLNTDKEKSVLFNMFILENTIPNKENEVKKNKLKI